MPTILSLLVPVYNEEKNIKDLYSGLKNILLKSGYHYELIFINDKSNDETLTVLNQIKSEDSNIRIINLNERVGQLNAYLLGFQYINGEIIATIDADLQYDPEDLFLFLEKIHEGFDFVSGWRINRKDPLYRKIISFIANRLISGKTGVKLHDYGSGFNVFRKELLPLFNFHKRDKIYLIKPVLVYLAESVSEIVIHHYPRLRGESKYSLISMARTGLKFLLNPLLRNGGSDVKSKSLVG